MISKPKKIPFHLCDAARIMFFGSFFEIYHMFLEESLPEMGIPWEDWFMKTTGAPVRGAQVQYDKPLAFGGDYIAKLWVKKIGESSVTFRFEMGTDETCHAYTEVTHVFVDFKLRTKTEIPKEIRQALTKHLQA
jgi:acyl-CoA thioesterase FadM